MGKIYDSIFAFAKFVIIFFFGGTSYYALELLFRSRSHVTMLFCGGVCFCVIYFIGSHLGDISFILRAVICSLSITSIEFSTGVILNLVLGLNIWNYSGMFLNFHGQICLAFSVLWFFLSIPALWVCSVTKKYIFDASIS